MNKRSLCSALSQNSFSYQHCGNASGTWIFYDVVLKEQVGTYPIGTKFKQAKFDNRLGMLLSLPGVLFTKQQLITELNCTQESLWRLIEELANSYDSLGIDALQSARANISLVKQLVEKYVTI